MHSRIYYGFPDEDGTLILKSIRELQSFVTASRMARSSLRVFVSSTSKDLSLHRQLIRDLILENGWQPVMMEHFGTSVEPTVITCQRAVESCDLVILLVAFRQGWVPTRDQGGDGARSVTAYELEAARKRDIPVRVLLARDSWPGNLWEDRQRARDWVQKFRQELNQVAVFFEADAISEKCSEPIPGAAFRAKVQQLLLDHREWLLARTAELASQAVAAKPLGAQTLLPSLLPLLPHLFLSRQDLAQAYSQSKPLGWENLPQAGDTLELLDQGIRNLATAPRQSGSGLFPLLAFIKLLSEKLEGEAAVALSKWLDSATRQLAGDDSDAQALRQALARLEPTRAKPPCRHLLVQISPLLCSTGKYSLKSWLFGGDDPTCLLAGDQELGRDAIPAVLSELRDELARQGIPLDDVWIEFLVPRDLLCADLDQWRVELDFLDSIPIGAEHRVVVRSLERMRRPRAFQALRTRFESLHRQSESTCQIVSCQVATDLGPVFRIEGRGGTSLYAQLREASRVVCAVLSESPKAEPSKPEEDVLNTLLAAGVPVVLWGRRENSPTESVHSSIHSLMEGTRLKELPDRIFEVRKQAVKENDLSHPGSHVTLLWDDPTRLSPDFDREHQFRPPRQA